MTGAETNPCGGANILYCEDFDSADIDDARLTQNDNFAAMRSLQPKPGAGHDGSGTLKLTLPDDKNKVQGELYVQLPRQAALFEIVFRTTAPGGFDMAGVAIPSFESGVTLTRGTGPALDLWNYSGSGGSNVGPVTAMTVDGSKWTYAAIEVDPTDTLAKIRAYAGPLGQPTGTNVSTTLTADFSGGIRYHFGPYRNEDPIMGGRVSGTAMVEVDWVRVTSR